MREIKAAIWQKLTVWQLSAVAPGTTRKCRYKGDFVKKPWCTLFGTLVPALFDSIGTGSRIGAGKNFRVQVDN